MVAKVNKITTGTFGNGDSIKIDVGNSVANINAKSTSDGKSVTNRAGSLTTYTQTLYTEGIQISKVGESFTHNPQDTSTASTGEFKMTIRVTNLGSNDVYVPLNTSASTTIDSSFSGLSTGVTYSMATSSSIGTTTGATATLSRVSGGTELTNSVRVSGGNSADFLFAVTFNPGLGNSTGQWRIQALAVGHAATDSTTATSFVNATPAEDFRTAFYTVNN